MTTRELPGFDQLSFTHQGRTHPVYRAGTGPGVIVIHEIPGLHPGMLAFAERLIAAGYTVYLPSLFGRPGQPASTGAVLGSVLGVCEPRVRPPGRPDQPDRDLAAGPSGHSTRHLLARWAVLGRAAAVPSTPPT